MDKRQKEIVEDRIKLLGELKPSIKEDKDEADALKSLLAEVDSIKAERDELACDTTAVIKLLEEQLAQAKAEVERLKKMAYEGSEWEKLSLGWSKKYHNCLAELFKAKEALEVKFGMWLCPTCGRGAPSGRNCHNCLELEIARIKGITVEEWITIVETTRKRILDGTMVGELFSDVIATAIVEKIQGGK